MTQKKKISRKLILIIAVVVAIVAVIAFMIIGSQNQLITLPGTPSPYVEVNYTTVGRYCTYPSSDNEACLMLNLTITNRGYADEVSVWLPSFTITMLNVSKVLYPPLAGEKISNSSDTNGWSFISTTLQSEILPNGESETGTIIFEFPSLLLNQTFTLQCSMVTTKHAAANVRISGS
jgi:hypothetical protein